MAEGGGVKFHYGPKGEIRRSIRQGYIGRNDMVVTSDTNELCYVDQNKSLTYMQSRTQRNHPGVPAGSSLDDFLDNEYELLKYKMRAVSAPIAHNIVAINDYIDEKRDVIANGVAQIEDQFSAIQSMGEMGQDIIEELRDYVEEAKNTVANGRGIESMTTYYCATSLSVDSSIVSPDNPIIGWSETPPALTEQTPKLWTYFKIVWTLPDSDGNSETIVGPYVVGYKSIDGINGSNGRSAYGIAIDNGFVGTESEWLQSLKGETGAASVIKGTVSDVINLPSITSAALGDCYIVGSDIYTKNSNSNTAWIRLGSFKGSPGTNGTNAYVHFAYSNDGGATIADSSINAQYMGVASTNSPTAPTSSGAYSWSKIVGPSGATGSTGVSIVSAEAGYALTDDLDTIPTTFLYEESVVPRAPTADNRYLWMTIKLTYSDDSTDYTSPCCISRYVADAVSGSNGVGIASITAKYATSSNRTQPSLSSFGLTVPTNLSGQFLWMYMTITYTSGTSVSTTPAIIGYVTEEPATLSAITRKYTLSESSTSVPSTATASIWSTTRPTPNAATPYLWAYDSYSLGSGSSISTAPYIVSFVDTPSSVIDALEDRIDELSARIETIEEQQFAYREQTENVDYKIVFSNSNDEEVRRNEGTASVSIVGSGELFVIHFKKDISVSSGEYAKSELLMNKEDIDDALVATSLTFDDESFETVTMTGNVKYYKFLIGEDITITTTYSIDKVLFGNRDTT